VFTSSPRRCATAASSTSTSTPSALHWIAPLLARSPWSTTSFADDTRWPAYRQSALAAGMRAVRAFPIVSLHVPLGSIVVHTHEPRGSSRSTTFGQTLANLTAVALSSATVDDRRVETSNSIEALLDGTMVIASATGMLAEVFGLPAEARDGPSADLPGSMTSL
jgi:hypothetical protein